MLDIDIDIQRELLDGLKLDLIDTIDTAIDEIGDRPDKVQEITDDCLERIIAEVKAFREKTEYCNGYDGTD